MPTALEVIERIGVIPMSIERPCTRPTKSEIRRWISQKAVLINGVTVDQNSVVEYPITQLVFFPKGKRRTTVC